MSFAIARQVAAAARAALDFALPPACAVCGRETDRARALCGDCWREAIFLTEPFCATCGAPHDGGFAPGGLCAACELDPPRFTRARAALIYEGAGRRIALSLKHSDRLDLARAAGPWMARAGRELIADADLIAPAPLHPLRLVKRRFNQAMELARWTARAAGAEAKLAPDLLTRTRATPSQEGRGRDARIANLDGAIALTPDWRDRIAGARVLLVDDVLTTGATLNACAEAALEAGAASVDALALARVARPI